MVVNINKKEKVNLREYLLTRFLDILTDEHGDKFGNRGKIIKFTEFNNCIYWVDLGTPTSPSIKFPQKSKKLFFDIGENSVTVTKYGELYLSALEDALNKWSDYSGEDVDVFFEDRDWGGLLDDN